MTTKISTALFFFLLPLFLFSQKKTLVKFEFPVGIMPDSRLVLNGQSFSIMYPTVYIPLHKHLDIGASYNSQKVNYYVAEQNPVNLSYKFYMGNIKYKVTSLYLKINLSASQKRVNPFFSYVLSFVKGNYTSPSRDSTSDYYSRNSYNFSMSNNISYGTTYDDNFSYSNRMTPAEEEVLKKSLSKSQLSHGVQVGIDYKILPFLNFFLKLSVFSVFGYSTTSKKENAFAIKYREDFKVYKISPQEYFMGGIIFKIDGGKKSLIK